MVAIESPVLGSEFDWLTVLVDAVIDGAPLVVPDAAEMALVPWCCPCNITVTGNADDGALVPFASFSVAVNL